MEGHDQPGRHDYRCRYTRGAYGCTVSVHDEEEAKTLCDLDDVCRGFVMSPLKSWTGECFKVMMMMMMMVMVMMMVVVVMVMMMVVMVSVILVIGYNHW